MHPWYAIDLIVEHEVTGIKIFERYKEASVRVGDTHTFSLDSNTDVLYTINTVWIIQGTWG